LSVAAINVRFCAALIECDGVSTIIRYNVANSTIRTTLSKLNLKWAQSKTQTSSPVP